MKKKRVRKCKKHFSKKTFIRNYSATVRLCFYLINLQKYGTKAELVEKTKANAKACLS